MTEPSPALEPIAAETGPIADPKKGDLPAGDEAKDVPLIPRGNRLRLVRGGAPTLVAGIAALILMGREGQLRWGVPLGILLVAATCFGIMDLLGTFDDPEERVASSRRLAELLPSVRGHGGRVAALAFRSVCAAAGTGLPQAVWGALVTLTFIAAVGVYASGRALGLWRLDEDGLERLPRSATASGSSSSRAALFFPLMGTSSLWDPWETHYGRSSREILARETTLDRLWWAQDGWFWSKPVLDMWMQAIAI